MLVLILKEKNAKAADNIFILDKNPREYLTSRDLTFSTKSYQHSTFFHWLSNRKRFAFESAIKWFLILERPRNKIIINKLGDGTPYLILKNIETRQNISSFIFTLHNVGMKDRSMGWNKFRKSIVRAKARLSYLGLDGTYLILEADAILC